MPSTHHKISSKILGENVAAIQFNSYLLLHMHVDIMRVTTLFVKSGAPAVRESFFPSEITLPGSKFTPLPILWKNERVFVIRPSSTLKVSGSPDVTPQDQVQLGTRYSFFSSSSTSISFLRPDVGDLLLSWSTQPLTPLSRHDNHQISRSCSMCTLNGEFEFDSGS